MRTNEQTFIHLRNERTHNNENIGKVRNKVIKFLVKRLY